MNDTYHTRYNNQSYGAVKQSVLVDLKLDENGKSATDIMNALTTAAVALSQGEGSETLIRLITLCHHSPLSPKTIRLMSQHLEHFEDHGQTDSADFENSALALCYLRDLHSTMTPTIAFASVIHGWRGRMAYELLAAVDYMTQAAIQLLLHGNLSYIREKLQSGLRRLTAALYEGIRESDTPAVFNFKATYFPDEHDRR